MDGYELTASGYEQYLAKNPDIDAVLKKDIQTKIEALRMIAGMQEEYRNALFDTGAFNDICKGYFKKAMENCGIERKMMNAVLDEFKWLLDTMSAAEAGK